MSQRATCKVYERISAMNLAGDGIRPGELDLTERAIAYCGFSPSSRILDVGCGTGSTLDRLSQAYEFLSVGVDLSSSLLNQGRRRNPSLFLARACGENLPILDAWADGVFSECSLSVMQHPCRALNEFRRVLKPGGRLIWSDVYSRNPAGAEELLGLPMDCCLKGAASREIIIERLALSGFKIDLWEDHSDLLAKFAVQLVLTCGSLEQFWLGAGRGTADPEAIRRAISRAKPGYFLLIAHKQG